MGRLAQTVGWHNLKHWWHELRTRPIKRFDTCIMHVQHFTKHDAGANPHECIDYDVGTSGSGTTTIAQIPCPIGQPGVPMTFEAWTNPTVAHAEYVATAEPGQGVHWHNFPWFAISDPMMCIELGPNFYDFQDNPENQELAQAPMMALVDAQDVALRDEWPQNTTNNEYEEWVKGHKSLNASSYAIDVRGQPTRNGRAIRLLYSKLYFTISKRNLAGVEENDTKGDLNETFYGEVIIGCASGDKLLNRFEMVKADGVDAVTYPHNLFIRKCIPAKRVQSAHSNGMEAYITQPATTENTGAVSNWDVGSNYSSVLKRKDHALFTMDHASMLPYYVDSNLMTVKYRTPWKIKKGQIQTNFSCSVRWNGNVGIPMVYKLQNGDYNARDQHCLGLDFSADMIPHNSIPEYIVTMNAVNPNAVGTVEYQNNVAVTDQMTDSYRLCNVNVRQVHYWIDDIPQ